MATTKGECLPRNSQIKNNQTYKFRDISSFDDSSSNGGIAAESRVNFRCTHSVVDKTDCAMPSGYYTSLSHQIGGGRTQMNYKRIRHTDVIVIGNGPSALALSAFLSGYRPMYNVEKPHPIGSLHDKLVTVDGESLFDQNLEMLAEGLDGRSYNAASLLYDSLVRPNADLGDEHPSTLSWSYRPEKIVKHVVLGKGVVGGTWAEFSPEISTVSFGSWLDLPAYSFRQWLETEGANFATELEMTTEATQEVVGRVPCAAVQQYFKDYVKYMELDRNFVEFATVTSVEKDQNEENEPKQDYCWSVYGNHRGGPFHFRAKKLVLATGASIPKVLNVPLEESSSFVLHSQSELESKIPLLVNAKRVDPVLVVGDGLSAADAVIRLLIAGIPVIHSFRKAPKDTKHILSKLSRVFYPEYHTVFQLMTGAVADSLYKVIPCSEVKCFHATDDVSPLLYGNKVTLKLKNNKRLSTKDGVNDKEDGCVDVDVSCAVILIGFKPNLSFFDDRGRRLASNKSKCLDSKSNVISVDVHCRCVNDASVYALGPLIGDNFVRYLVGGSMAAAADLCREFSRV